MTPHALAGEGKAMTSGISVDIRTRAYEESFWRFNDKKTIQVCRRKQCTNTHAHAHMRTKFGRSFLLFYQIELSGKLVPGRLRSERTNRSPQRGRADTEMD